MTHRLNGGFFKAAIESSLDCVRVLDPDGLLLFMNRAGMAAFEIEDVGPLVGRSCPSLWPEPAASQIARGIEAVRHNETCRFEAECPTATGTAKWWDVSLAPVNDADGELAGIIATSRDITDFKLARIDADVRELSLARTAAALRSAFRIAHVGGWEVDFVRRRTLFSEELCELLGSPPLPDMPMEAALDFWCEEDRAAFDEALEQVSAHGERLTFEGRSLAPDGSIRSWRLFGEPVVKEGVCVALRGAAQEVTVWRQTQERERIAVQAADAMSCFLATMSHELRTPLNAVLGMSQAIGRGELSDPQRRRLDIVEASAQELLLLLNDLLDLAKIESGHAELEEGLVDIQALADSARQVFAALVQDKPLQLELAVAPAVLGEWVGDPCRVQQILRNLVSNAIKFTPGGAIKVGVSQAAEHLVLTVEDSGIGIAPHKLTKIFDRFVQGDASTTRRFGGAGLGLTICRDLAELMGGDIQVESVLGEGSTFVVRLPLARSTAEVAASCVGGPGCEPQPACSPLRVLAAEDNLTNQLVLRTLLEVAGIEPTLVPNGREAVDAWNASAWDVVLMDIQMPVMDGLSAVKLIRQAERERGLARTPIIAVTANAMPHHRIEYLAAGMDAMVAKPIELTTLLKTIEAVMQPHELYVERLAG
jgi:PAS domain S-box-containing protein